MTKTIFALCASLTSAIAAPPTADVAAIKSMAGSFEVEFTFEETVALAPNYELKKPYRETALELVKVAAESEDQIVLQHILVVKSKKTGEPRIIKHWAQIWTYEDRELLDYSGKELIHEWERHDLSEEEAKGTWTQLVTQVDDTPRYESYGKWTHQDGISTWQSGQTRRPLPRRDYTKREDYDYLRVTNSHVITPTGWVHKQDNNKIVDRTDGTTTALCHEVGLNTYTRIDAEQTRAADEWWVANAPFWNVVRDFWTDHGEAAQRNFSYHEHGGMGSLKKALRTLRETKASQADIHKALSKYLITDKS